MLQCRTKCLDNTDAVSVLSVLDESVSRICSPYEPISKGGFLS
jgi:hypothetical protein